MPLGLGAPLGVACETVVDLGQSVLEHRAPFGELGGTDVEVATLPGDGGGALVELELHQRTRLEQRLRLGRVGLEHGDAHFERGDAFDIGLALRLQRVLLRGDRGELHVALRSFGVHPRTRTLHTVELVDGASFGVGRGGFVSPAGLEIGTRGVERLAHDHAGLVGFLGPGAGVVECGAGRSQCVATQAPRTTPAQTVTALGDDGERRLAQHEIEGARPVAVGEQRTVEEALDRRGEAGDGAAHRVGEETSAGHAGSRRARPVRSRGVGHDQQRTRVTRGQSLERLTGGDGSVDHDRTHRVAQHRVHRGFEARVDIEVVDQRTDHARDVVECGERGVVAAGVERGGERLGARLPTGGVGIGGAQRIVGDTTGVDRASDGVARGFGGGAERGQRCGDASVRRGEVVVLRGERGDTRTTLLEPGRGTRQLGVDAGKCLTARLEVASRHAQIVSVARRQRALGERALRGGEVVLAALDGRALLLESRAERGDLVELAPQLRGVGDERLEHSLVGDRRQLALQAARLLAQQRVEPGHPRPQGLDAGERVGEIAVAGGGEGLLGFEHRHVEVAQSRPHRALTLVELGALITQTLALGLQARDLVTGEVDADRPQLLDQPTVAACRVGLTLQRCELAAHLTQQVVEAQEVALGRLQAAFGTFASLPELQDARRFLDDRTPVLGTRVEHRVELTLPHDHVLLAADAGVGEQLLDVEQPARRAVDLILGVAGSKQRAGDRHLAELDRQQARGVVDAQRHLGAPERGAVGGAREDDVVHLAAAQRARALGPEHPGDGVDEVRLP